MCVSIQGGDLEVFLKPFSSCAFIRICPMLSPVYSCVVGWVVGLCGWRGGIGYYVCESTKKKKKKKH